MRSRVQIWALLALLLGVTGASGQGGKAPDLTAILKKVEDRYNSTKTLEATFTQTLMDRGRTRAVKKGTLYLSKPKKTRWAYSMPEGDWFLSDEKYAYDYSKAKNTVEQTRLKETEDMRIPLAFLVGKLDFLKDFDKFKTRPEGSDVYIEMTPKNDKLWITQVAMQVAPDSSIRRVRVTVQDSSVTEFTLEGEKRNVPVADSLFRFTAPPGAKVVDAGE